MVYTLAAVSYGIGKFNGTHHECEAEPAKLHAAPSMAPLALAPAPRPEPEELDLNVTGP